MPTTISLALGPDGTLTGGFNASARWNPNSCADPQTGVQNPIEGFWEEDGTLAFTSPNVFGFTAEGFVVAEVVAEVEGEENSELLDRLDELEVRRREGAAEEAVLLAELERRKVYGHDGHASMWGLLRSSVGWSDAECRSRMRVARLVAEFADAGETLHETSASVANVTEIARGFANPRCGPQIESVIGTMLTEACRLEHDDLKIIVRQWERRADADGSHRDRAANHEARNAHLVVFGGVGNAAAQWGEADGLANREIFERYVEAEWHADWECTVATYGDAACKSLMPRTNAQRRADAMSKIFLAAASTPRDAKAPEPVVNIHLDHHSFCDLMVQAEFFPERFVDPFETRGALVTERRCETEHGDPFDPKTALQAAFEGYVRFVIHDDQGVPIHWGQKRRLFTGAVREAVMSQWPRCTHPGCRVRARSCQADHTTDYARGGPTDPANGNPRCLRRNLLKNRGYTVERDRTGHWHTYRPDGTEIC